MPRSLGELGGLGKSCCSRSKGSQDGSIVRSESCNLHPSSRGHGWELQPPLGGGTMAFCQGPSRQAIGLPHSLQVVPNLVFFETWSPLCSTGWPETRDPSYLAFCVLLLQVGASCLSFILV